jgi:DNA-binding GntR family transcriptional regulator
MIEAFRNRDSDGAERLMKTHLEDAVTVLQRQLEEEASGSA